MNSLVVANKIIEVRDKPKRPLSAYNLFFKSEREVLLKNRPVRPEGVPRRGHGKMGFAEMARTIADRWNSIDKDTKARFEALAKVEKQAYRKKLAEWKQLVNPPNPNNNRKSKKNVLKNEPDAPVSKEESSNSQQVEPGRCGPGLYDDRHEKEDTTTTSSGEFRDDDDHKGTHEDSSNWMWSQLNESFDQGLLAPDLLLQMEEQSADDHNHALHPSWQQNHDDGDDAIVVPVSAFQVRPANEVTERGIQILAQQLDTESMDFFIDCFSGGADGAW